MGRVILFLTLATILSAASAADLPIKLTDGTTVTCARVVQKYATAVRFIDDKGIVRMARYVDQPANVAQAVMDSPASQPAPMKAQPTPTPAPARATIKLVPVGSKSSTDYSYIASWGSRIYTTTASSTYEARITLWGAPSATVDVVLFMGGELQMRKIALKKLSEVILRMSEPDRSTEVMDLKALGYYSVSRGEQKPLPFVQVQLDGVVIGEEGYLPRHKRGEPIKISRPVNP